MVDFLWTAIAFVCTLMVFSYMIGDNFMFRLAIHLFIGVSAGYAASVAWQSVIWPMIILPVIRSGLPEERLLAIVPLLMSILLLMKISPRFSRLGSPSLAYLVGVGAAVAIGGGVIGTIFPQTLAAINGFDIAAAQQTGVGERLLDASVMLLGTVSTLIYFHFGARAKHNQKPRRMIGIEYIAKIGQVFIAITFGVMFAGIYLAAFTALIERVHFLQEFIATLVRLGA